MEIKNPLGKSAEITLKGVWIGFMVLVLMIPTFMIQDLVRERQARQHQAEAEISDIWSHAQTVTGPFISIPYQEISSDNKTWIRKQAYILPDVLDIKSEITPEIRHRSIYDVAVYTSFVELTGHFNNELFNKLNIDSAKIDWDDITVQLGISDFRGIGEQIHLNWDGQTIPMEGGVISNELIEKGIKAKINPKHVGPLKFSIQLLLKGSEQIAFAPLGKVTTAHMKSNWKNPSFTGAFLPTKPATITDTGFEADWKVLELNRNYPQIIIGEGYEIPASAFGVKFIQLSDVYSKTQRSVKYAFLFIALTFALYFFMELLLKNKVHSIQYVLVGFAMCLFYLLLLSLSEYIGFDKAYAVAAIGIISMIGMYTKAVFKKGRSAFIITGVIALLYAFIYLLIQLEEKALLIGSISLFVLLAIVMYFTRNFDWGMKDEVK